MNLGITSSYNESYKADLTNVSSTFAKQTPESLRQNKVVYIFEDNVTIANAIAKLLKQDGYAVQVFYDIKNADNLIRVGKPAIVLTDIHFEKSDYSGVDLCRSIRNDPDPSVSNQPIIIISCKSLPQEILNGLDCANDYLVKPFLYQELRSRMDIILRRLVVRKGDNNKVLLQYGDIELDPRAHLIRRSGKILRLAPIEFWILSALVQNTHRVLRREELIEEIWGNANSVEQRTIDVHITRLRKVLLQASTDGMDVIITVRLAGYKLNHPLYY